MSNETKTALEWFSNQSWKLKIQLENNEISLGEYAVTYVKLIEQAKEMEKQQIKNAFINGYLDSYNAQNNINADEIFYQKTYGGNK
jgi:hypothetical protein